MRTSAAVALLFAGLAMASPLKQAAKKDYVYDVVTDLVYVTVTDETTVQAAATPAVVTVVSQVTQAVTTAVTVSSAVNKFHGLGNLPAPGGFHRPEESSVDIQAMTFTSSTSAASVVVVTVQPTTSSVVVVPTTSSVVVVPTTSSVVAVPTTSSVAAKAEAIDEPASTAAAAAATSSLDASDATSTDPVVASLYHHNVHRTNHSAPAVSWNATLASYASTVAASCVYAHDLTPGGGGYGQNIAVYGETGDVESLGEAHEIAQASTDMWYNGEINEFLPSYYGQDNPDFSNFDAWGHFSQIVWKSTEEIGCASQFCDAGTIFSGFGSWFTVCNYGPEGNMGGEYGANVLEPLGDPTVTC